MHSRERLGALALLCVFLLLIAAGWWWRNTGSEAVQPLPPAALIDTLPAKPPAKTQVKAHKQPGGPGSKHKQEMSKRQKNQNDKTESKTGRDENELVPNSANVNDKQP